MDKPSPRKGTFALAAIALSGFGCTAILGDIDFNGSGGSGGAGGSTSSTGGTGGATTSSGTGGSAPTCADVTCDAKATCDDTSGMPICTCPQGTIDVHGDGSLCFDDPCLGDPCNGHGTCDNSTLMAVCTCDPTWAGAACDVCVRYVDAAAVGANDGSTWADAFTTVQPALDAADAAVTGGLATCDVWVKEGTYYAYVSSSADSFTPKKNIGLYGGFAGTETERDEADPAANKTTLSGHKSANDASAVLHVVALYNVPGVVIDGFTIRDGDAAGGGNPEDARGGGVLFYGFNAPVNGTVRRCEITANHAGDGGGIATVWGDATNIPTVIDCDIHDNKADGSGGGMFLENPSFTLTGTTFRANTAGKGGGLWADTLLVASDVTFANNIALTGDGGGLLLRVKAGSSLTNVIFTDNYASVNGGGLEAESTGSAALVSCLFVGNQASSGGAVFDAAGGLTWVSSTITGNRGTTGGDGILWTGAVPSLTNTIVWGNPNVASAATGKDVDPPDWVSLITSHSDIHSYMGTDGTTIDADPLFVKVPVAFDHVTVALGAVNQVQVSAPASFSAGQHIEIGGDGVDRTVSQVVANTVTFSPTLAAPAPQGTTIRNWGGAFGALDAGLTAGSMCIDAGDSAAAPLLDLAGKPRVGTADIGAYEKQ